MTAVTLRNSCGLPAQSRAAYSSAVSSFAPLTFYENKDYRFDKRHTLFASREILAIMAINVIL